jgi:hypothetical protein
LVPRAGGSTAITAEIRPYVPVCIPKTTVDVLFFHLVDNHDQTNVYSSVPEKIALVLRR